jgi:hypothetical protein
MSPFLDKAAERLRKEMETELRIELDQMSANGIPKKVADAIVQRAAKAMPMLVTSKVGNAHARIYTQAQMENLLVDFATQLVLSQLYDP